MKASSVEDETQIRERLEQLVAAIRAKDIGAVLGFYARDITSYDFEPPLVHRGVEAKAANWKNIFSLYRDPLGYEMRDVSITVSGDIAFAHSLNRIAGTLQNGREAGHWVRCTNCFRKIDGRWIIVHDHVSVPADAGSGRAMLQLVP